MRLFGLLVVFLLTVSPALPCQADTRSKCLEGDLLSCSLILARGPSPFSADNALRAVAEGFVEAGRLEEALGAVEEMRGDFWKPAAEAAVVKLLARKSQHERALKMAAASKGDAPLIGLGDFYLESGDLKRVQAIVSKMADRMNKSKVILLSELAQAHHRAGRQKKTGAIFSKVEKIARSQEKIIPRSDLLLLLAELSAKIDKPDRAVKLAMEALSIADDKNRTGVQRALHQHYSHKVAVRARVFRLALGLDRLELALKLAREQPEPPGFHSRDVTRAVLMPRIARALIDKGQIKKAQSLIKKDKRASTCGPRGLQSVVAVGYDKAGDEARALSLFEGMKRDERMRGMCAIAEGRFERGKPEAAMQMAKRIEESGFRAYCLTNLAERAMYARKKDWAVSYTTRALKLLRHQDKDKFRSYRLIRACKILLQMGRAKQAPVLIDEIAASIRLEEEKKREFLWGELLSALTHAGHCDLALKSIDRSAPSQLETKMASFTCARKQHFGAALRLVLRLDKAQERAAALASVGGLAAQAGWKPDPATLDLMRKNILDRKP